MTTPHEKIQESTQNLSLYEFGEEPIRMSSDIHQAHFSEVKSKMKEILDCYFKIFGGKEWKLGYFCVQEGFQKRFSFEEYAQLEEPKHCSCGSQLLPCRQIEEPLVVDLLMQTEQEETILFLYQPEKSIEGLTLGTFLDVSKIAERALVDDYNYDIHNEQLKREIQKAVEQYCLKYKISGKIFYGISGGLIQEARTGLHLLVLLFRCLLFYAYKRGQKVLIGLTHRNTPMLKILLLWGMEIICEFNGGNVLMGFHNVEAFLKITQNWPEERIKRLMRENEILLTHSSKKRKP